MYWITARLGAIRGSSWPIQERSLVFGRGRGCDVTIADPLISRQHCTVYLDRGEVRLRDLGSSNLTLVNGEPVREATLRPGDEVAVGGTVFVVSLASTEPEPQTSGKGDGDTMGLSRADGPHTPRFATPPPVQGLSTIEDYVDLFRLCRNVSNVASIAGLLDVVQRELEPRIATRSLCFARARKDAEFTVYHREGDAALPADLAPSLDLIRRSFEGQQMLQQRLEGPVSAYVAVAFPMTAGQEKVGVFAMCALARVVNSDDNTIHFLGAAAYQLAPFFHMIEQVESLRIENERLRAGATETGALVGESPAMRKAHAQLREAARSGMSVLIMGETGTGKELAARLLHEASDRASKPFVAVNCAAIPPDLMESEFFGYEKGAFTGAMGRKIGRMEEAQGGTLFLDEIGDLSLENQARILRAIENGTFYRVGGNREISVDVRVIAATNKDIPAAVQEGRFRADLYHRINGFVIELPPLRERPEDIPILAQHFIRLTQAGRAEPERTIHPDALLALSAWHWPGNVREFRNCIERACYLTTDGSIQVRDLRLPKAILANLVSEEERSLAEVERKHIIEVLEKAGGNITQAAKLLGVSRPTVYRKMAEYDIREPTEQ